MVVAGARVTLREFRFEDAPQVHQYASDPRVVNHLNWGPNGWGDTTAFLALVKAEAEASPRVSYQLAITENSTGLVMGAVRLKIESPRHRRAAIGYVLAASRWGLGYGTEAAQLMVQWAIRDAGMHRIEATCDPANHGSRRVLEKIGLQYEGYRRHDFLVRGHWRDSLMFALIGDPAD
ncbi:MAG: GNAT family N-acetyltransferase [Sulfobacillus sp.]